MLKIQIFKKKTKREIEDFFKRNWKYKHGRENDQHLFWLDDPVLGKYNKLQLDFYRN